ncbi:hypothetical protein JCM24511_02876 [Saitozyma sp. JCM 24511]|nr:hypothetical protein JCM24511_02876 [Saitozyma sp. JCM 24511]
MTILPESADDMTHDPISPGPTPGPCLPQIELDDLAGHLSEEQIAELDRDLSAADGGNKAKQSTSPSVHVPRAPQSLEALGAKRISAEVDSLPDDPAVLKSRLKGALDALGASHKASAEVRDKNTRLVDEKRVMREEVSARRRAQAVMARELEKLRRESAEWESSGYGTGYGKQGLIAKETGSCEGSEGGAREGTAEINPMRIVLS